MQTIGSAGLAVHSGHRMQRPSRAPSQSRDETAIPGNASPSVHVAPGHRGGAVAGASEDSDTRQSLTGARGDIRPRGGTCVFQSHPV